jgi:hypothetical protein
MPIMMIMMMLLLRGMEKIRSSCGKVKAVYLTSWWWWWWNSWNDVGDQDLTWIQEEWMLEEGMPHWVVLLSVVLVGGGGWLIKVIGKEWVVEWEDVTVVEWNGIKQDLLFVSWERERFYGWID